MAVIIQLPPVFQNDTWNGMYSCKFSSDGTSFASNLSLVRFTLKNSEGTTTLELTSATTSEIQITSASGWEFDIKQRQLGIPPDTYSFGIETTDAAGIVKTRVTGVLPVTKDPV